LQRALNAHTPEDISILEVMLAPQGFHAIRDASRKTYRYQIQYGRSRHPLKRNDHWYCPLTLDVPSMQRAASMLVGEHDFASFQAVGAERDSTVRLVTRLECKPIGDQRFPALWFEITCNGFLYNMVRIIVGTLVQVGQGSRPVEWVAEVLAGRDRTAAGPTAPAHGLVLLSVEYDQLQFLAEPE
jgi:tRNA pseudouridine38-40 synthase